MLEIVEKYFTLGGEAPLIGQPIYIIRFTGCNLNCIYCDTKYKDEINYKYSVEELITDIKKAYSLYPDIKILFTGGEPLLEKRKNYLFLIMKKLNNIDFYIETNGTINLTGMLLKNNYFIIDYKAPSSGAERSFFENNLKLIRAKNDCIKFIINKNDFNWLTGIIKSIKKIKPEIILYVSPQWNMVDLDVIADFILKNKLPLNLSIQLHKFIWKDKDRGV